MRGADISFSISRRASRSSSAASSSIFRSPARMLLRPRTRGFRGTRTIWGESSRLTSSSFMDGSGRWLSLRRNDGVAKCSFDTEDGVFPPLPSTLRPFLGVANISNNRFPFDPGVLLFRRAAFRAAAFRGVAFTDPWVPGNSSGFSGVVPNRSNSPRTCPSFCGVGPMAVFLAGANRFRTTLGESYGSTSQGFKEDLDGVFMT